MLDNDETSVCHLMDTPDEKAHMAPPLADRIVFETGLYCFAPDVIMGYE